MKAILAVLATLALVAVPVRAQSGTTYTQSAADLCRPGSLVCNPQLLPSGSGNQYYLACPYDQLEVGCTFDLTVGGVRHQGQVSQVNTQFPAPGASGAFGFAWTTTDGLSGTVGGQGHWARLGRWLYPEIDSSTVTVN